MTRTNAGRITGLHIRQIDKITWGAFDTEDARDPVATGSHRIPSHALASLVAKVYAIRRREAWERDDGKCRRCGRPAEHCHHKKYRSHGRDDSLDNLDSLCSECHELEHKKKKGLAA